MKLIGKDEHGFPLIFEATRLSVGKRGEEFDENSCAIDGIGYDSTENCRILSAKLNEKGIYYGLTKQEALTILETSVKSDTIDLRKIGDFHIYTSSVAKNVFIMNDYDEWSDEEIPILVKIVKDD